MKILFTLTVVLFLNMLSVYAQAVDVVTGLNNPKRMCILGNDLYFTDDSGVSKIDITDSSPTPVPVVSDLPSATGLTIHDNILYIAQFDLGQISKIDITDPSATVEVFASGLNTPNVLKVHENYLYYSDNNTRIVGRFNLDDPSPILEIIADFNFNFGPVGMAFGGNILFMTNPNRVSKIDITNVETPVNVAVGLERPLSLALTGNDLYIGDYIDNKILIKDITDNGPLATDFLFDVVGPRDLAISGNSLYILEGIGNKISKVQITLGVEELTLKNNYILFPNPTSQSLNLSNINAPISYEIYSITGSKIKSGTLAHSEKINVEALPSGVYMLKVDDKKTIKFIKE